MTVSKKRVRKYGVDILRMLSMFMIVLLHVLGHGGVLRTCKKGSSNYAVAFYIETAAYCAVNVFGMISGYLHINLKHNNFKIIPLCLTLYFYSVTMGLLAYLFQRPLYNKFGLLKGIILPVSSKHYWYFNSYFCLYFLIPYINKVLNALTKEEFKKLIITIFTLFTVLPLIFLNRQDLYLTKRGYSPWWLGILYVIGAYYRLYPVKMSKIFSFLLYIGSVTIAWASKVYRWRINFLHYDSFFILTSGIFLLLFFTEVNITNNFLRKLIVLGSSVAFSVYVIHVNYFFYSSMGGRFRYISKSSIHGLVLKVLAATASIYFPSSIIDLFRHYLFKYLKVNNIPIIISDIISKMTTNNYQKLSNDETDGIINEVNSGISGVNSANNSEVIIEVKNEH